LSRVAREAPDGEMKVVHSVSYQNWKSLSLKKNHILIELISKTHYRKWLFHLTTKTNTHTTDSFWHMCVCVCVRWQMGFKLKSDNRQQKLRDYFLCSTKIVIAQHLIFSKYVHKRRNLIHNHPVCAFTMNSFFCL
jgi:hypothetical protein